MKKTLFLLCTLVFYAGCASGPQTTNRSAMSGHEEKRVEGQIAREGGLSDKWILKDMAPTQGAQAENPAPQAEERLAAGTSGSAVSIGSGGVETVDQADIELRKEELVVGKREISNGGVLVRTVVRTENVSQPIDLRREEYVIERIAANQAQPGGGPGVDNAFQGREVYIPLMREEPVTSKRTLLTENVTVGKQIETDRETITRPVRTEDVQIVKNPDLSDARFSHVPRGTAPIHGPEPSVATAARPAGDTSGDTLTLAKEQFIVGKRDVDNGGVYLQKVVRTQDASQPVDLRREEFKIDRTPAGNQPVDNADFSPREIRVNLSREQAVVGTRNYVTEIVRVRKQTQTDNQIVSGTVRNESLEIVKSSDQRPVAQGGTSSVIQSGSSSAIEPGYATATRETTITGKAVCGKCQLKQTASCQNEIQVKNGSRTLTYFVVQNDVSKNFHEEMCRHSKNVTATGTVREVDGKLEFAPTRIVAVE
jgi:uncharacterized protein (TIGR02271 family)